MVQEIKLQFDLRRGRNIYNSLNDSFFIDKSFDVNVPSSGSSIVSFLNPDTKAKVAFLSYSISVLEINWVMLNSFSDKTKSRIAAFFMKAEVLDDLKKLGLKI